MRSIFIILSTGGEAEAPVVHPGEIIYSGTRITFGGGLGTKI